MVRAEAAINFTANSRRRVPVPQVYVRAQPGDLDNSNQSTSGLLAGRSVNIQMSGDVSNGASIAGRQLVNIAAGNISNEGTISADRVLLNARVDLNNIGGTITGQSGVALSAGRDVNILSTTRSSTSGGLTSAFVPGEGIAGVGH